MKDQYILTPYFLDRPEGGLQPLAAPDWLINNPELPVGSPQERMVILYRRLASLIRQAVIGGKRPVSIAGDCCTSMGVLAGLAQADIQPTLIWFDAHGDFNTWETTPSGFLGGMPLAMVVGRGEQTIMEGIGLAPLPEKKVILTDARDLDAEEGELVAAAEIVHLSRVEDLLNFPLPEGPLYVHFDADVLDPTDAPAMNYLANGGPSVAVVRSVLRRLAESGRVVAVSLSLWSPALDGNGRSRQVVMDLLQELLTP